MKREDLVKQIQKKKSFLCVGLDPDLEKIPKHLLDCEDPIFEFNKIIIDNTKDFAVAFKPNIAFYEVLGPSGWETLRKTIEYIPDDLFVISDAKRGDIGNTSNAYAKAHFEKLGCDAITISPFMGEDSVKPFLNFEGKWTVVLALTSNTGSIDFQFVQNPSGTPLYSLIIRRVSEWGTPDNLMFVVGATKAEELTRIRKIIPNHFLLIPGVGHQGGSLEEVCKFGIIDDCGLLVNSSRGIIYASNGEDFGKCAMIEAEKLAKQMSKLIRC